MWNTWWKYYVFVCLINTTTNLNKNAFKKVTKIAKDRSRYFSRNKIIFIAKFIQSMHILHDLHHSSLNVPFFKIQEAFFFGNIYSLGTSPPYFEHKYFLLKRKMCLQPWSVRRSFFRGKHFAKVEVSKIKSKQQSNNRFCVSVFFDAFLESSYLMGTHQMWTDVASKKQRWSYQLNW